MPIRIAPSASRRSTTARAALARGRRTPGSAAVVVQARDVDVVLDRERARRRAASRSPRARRAITARAAARTSACGISWMNTPACGVRASAFVDLVDQGERRQRALGVGARQGREIEREIHRARRLHDAATLRQARGAVRGARARRGHFTVAKHVRNRAVASLITRDDQALRSRARNERGHGGESTNCARADPDLGWWQRCSPAVEAARSRRPRPTKRTCRPRPRRRPNRAAAAAPAARRVQRLAGLDRLRGRHPEGLVQGSRASTSSSRGSTTCRRWRRSPPARSTR